MASWLHLRAVAFVMCMTEFTTKDDWQLVPQVTYSVIKCEGKFSKGETWDFQVQLSQVFTWN